MTDNVARIYTKLPKRAKPTAIYASMARQVPANILLAFGPGVYGELRQELHSIEAVQRWALELADKLGRPVLLNVPDKDGSSNTLAIAPPGWSSERLAGYVGARHQELEAEFGPVEHDQGELGGPRRSRKKWSASDAIS
jgi:hypothetical protein